MIGVFLLTPLAALAAVPDLPVPVLACAIQRLHPTRKPADVALYAETHLRLARAYGLDPLLLTALAAHESDHRWQVFGPACEVGIYQVLPRSRPTGACMASAEVRRLRADRGRLAAEAGVRELVRRREAHAARCAEQASAAVHQGGVRGHEMGASEQAAGGAGHAEAPLHEVRSHAGSVARRSVRTRSRTSAAPVHPWWAHYNWGYAVHAGHACRHAGYPARVEAEYRRIVKEVTRCTARPWETTDQTGRRP